MRPPEIQGLLPHLAFKHHMETNVPNNAKSSKGRTLPQTGNGD